jgi:hypothetical protein
MMILLFEESRSPQLLTMWIRAALILSLALPASAFLPPVVTPFRSVRCNVGKKGSDEIAMFDKERADSLISRLGDAAKETKAAPAPAPAPKAASAPNATPAPKAAVAPAPKAVAASSGTSAGTSSPTTVAGGLFVLAAGGLIAWRKERTDGDGGDLLAGLMGGGGGGGGVAVVGKGIEPAAVSTKATAEWKREQALSPAELAKSTAQWKREQAPANPGLFSQGKAKAAAVAKLSAEILEKKKATPSPTPAPALKPAPARKPASVAPKPAPVAPKPAPATAPAATVVESPGGLTKSTAQWKRDEQGGALVKNWPRTTAVLRALRLMRR